MALSETTALSKTEKSPSDRQKHDRREKPPTKVIVRRLPPGMNQEEFVSQVSPLPDHDHIYLVRGDLSLGENAFSRIYINFLNPEDIFNFREKFDNYVFVDGKGHEYAAVVEFASFQKIPKKRGKSRPDPKVGTIESDQSYLDFVESLKQQPSQEEKPEFSYQPSNENKIDQSTPLLDFIKQKKIDRMKSREEKREERRRREIERKKLREEEKRKRFDENSPAKSVTVIKSNKQDEKVQKEKQNEEKDKQQDKEKSVEKEKEKYGHSSSYKNKEKRFDDYKSSVKPKGKYSSRQDKYDTYDKRDYKSRRDDYRNRRYDEHRKDDYNKKEETKPIATVKKVKKYSERREERKLELKRGEEAEQKKDEANSTRTDESKAKENESKHQLDRNEENEERAAKEERRSSREDHEDSKSDDQEKMRNKENDPRAQRRIRNKDRPTMQLYQPGMLSKRRSHDDDKSVKENSGNE